jgi:hypothetical protein
VNIVIFPTLDGLASERLRAFAAQLASIPAAEADIRDVRSTFCGAPRAIVLSRAKASFRSEECRQGHRGFGSVRSVSWKRESRPRSIPSNDA